MRSAFFCRFSFLFLFFFFPFFFHPFHFTLLFNTHSLQSTLWFLAIDSVLWSMKHTHQLLTSSSFNVTIDDYYQLIVSTSGSNNNDGDNSDATGAIEKSSSDRFVRSSSSLIDSAACEKSVIDFTRTSSKSDIDRRRRSLLVYIIQQHLQCVLLAAMNHLSVTVLMKKIVEENSGYEVVIAVRGFLINSFFSSFS